uniref:Mitotic checkpoint serine/threonineprotein kinase BUB1 betalike [Meleagris gallopavo] n=1 Tax=Lepeophtheirus salmonis TaxID=72036 RepID=A0A0K2U3Z0_LEPSM
MANNNSAEWELSKENIQPLRKGRKVEKLAQDPREIESERQTYEANLRFYNGSDLLKPWYDYVLWLEQTFPKGGTEGGLNTLLKKCMTEFKSNANYNQDPRYLDVWIKYAGSTSKPLDCYNFMYREKLCTECYRFYISWAKELEESGQAKRAEMVFQSALAKEFSPEEKEFLSNERLQFETRVAKQVMDNLAKSEEEKPNPSSTEEREALSRLKGRGKKQVVGSLRVGSVKLNSGPGTLVHQEILENNLGKPKFDVLEENASDARTNILPSGPSNNENFPGTQSQNLENEIGPSKWTSSRIGKKSLAVPMNQISVKPKFEIHQDEDIQQPASTPCKIGGTALSTKKVEKESIVPVALFEPFDPSIKPMYCKHLIYQGVSEISFEELRAIPYLQNMKDDEMVRKIEEQKKSFENAIKLQEQQFNDKLCILQKEIFEIKGLGRTDNKSVSSDRSDSSKDNSGVTKMSNNENNPFPDGGADDTKSLLLGYDGSSKESSQLISNSPTVNTMNIMKNIWASPSNQSKVLSKESSFETYDDQVKEPKAKMTSFQVYEEGESQMIKKPTFEIFTDEEPISKPKENESRKLKKKEAAFEIFVDDQETETAQDNDLDVGESNNFVKPKMPPKPGFGANATMVVTSLEDFSKKAFVSSTPAFGKRFMPDDDENTCAVPILFKKPIEPEKKPEEQEHNGGLTVNVIQDLSTIMETSRENDYKSSSSSSSSASTTNGGLLSQFSHIQPHENVSSVADTGELKKAAPQFNFLSKGSNETTSYMADENSPVQTTKPPPPLHFLYKGSNETTGYMADVNSPVKTPKPPPSKRPCHKFAIKCPTDDEEDDDQFGGIMANYENELKNRKGPFTPKASFSELCSQNDNASFFQQSLKASFIMDRSAKADSMFQSTCDISTPNLEISNIGSGEDNFSPQADESVGELSDKFMGVMVQPTVYDLSNPFNEKVQRDILRSLKTPLTERHGFSYSEELMPKISSNSVVKIGKQFFGIKSFVGEGAFGKIFKAVRHNNKVNDTICEMNLIFKVQKPSREWEFYICSEVQKRSANYGSFMSIPRCYSFMNGSIFASEYLPASLLDILNTNSKKMADEIFAIFFIIQICELVQRLHDARIIHADIKPDNIMLREKPFLNQEAKSASEMFPRTENPCLQLIDFGRSIDMSLCKEGTSFTHVFKSKGACIPEMLSGNPWSYQIDYFGIAATAYCLKFGSYMKLVEKNGIFTHSGHYKRWWNINLWKEFYHEFLNIEDGSKLPNLKLWKSKFEDVLFNKNVANEFNSIFKEIEALNYNSF